MRKSTKNGLGFSLGVILLAMPMVANFEGTFLTSYADPVGIPTVCMGETDRELVMRERFTEQECMAVLGASLTQHAIAVSSCLDRPLQAHEAAAVLSWTYNVGVHAACNSTLVRKLNAGAPPAEWCAELDRWVYAGGRRLNGLVKRRAAERRMCETGTWE